MTKRNQLAATEQTRATMAALKGLGVLVAIDDFGTGYSSLGYISWLRPDKLKVDMSLVSEVDVDAKRAGLVVAGLAMVRGLHLIVVAEGVETEAEQAFLQAHGCDMAQGYLRARPIPAPEFETWMARVDGGPRPETGMAAT
ncbi:EAL domain-containing protein [Massilia sp. YIM B02443]|uniref:EAL domain-containing protein n=1 Tax=Massilia sp. YIM B02443 TaxID=3050127 RepID=UPI0025B6662D|nr:EAL domain-containing protein [Massilia sp. YIM B02443]